jgi:HEAT repeat protein
LIDVLKRQEFNSKLSAETIGMIAAALGGIGKDAVDPLIREMGSEFRQVRFGVAVALVQTGDAKAIQSVRNAALHGDPEDRQMFKMVMGE